MKRVLILLFIFLLIPNFISAINDVNNDGVINRSDISLIASYYKSNNASLDKNNDGIVDLFDLVIISKTTDLTAPVISNANPSGALAAGTTQTTMMVSTNESANCKYSTTNQSFAAMATNFSSTGGTNHTATISGLTNGSSHTYYVRCRDGPGSSNLASTTISFSVSSSGGGGGGDVGMVFASDWGTATGTSDAALRDTGKSVDWPWVSSTTNGVLSVVNAESAGLIGWPTTNARRITVTPVPDPAYGETRFQGSDGIPEMDSNGDVLAFRWYIYVPTITWPTGAESNHNIQGGSTGNTWRFRTVMGTTSGGDPFEAGFSFISSTSPYVYRLGRNPFPNGDLLDRGVTYRIEIKFARLSSTTFNALARVYEGNSLMPLYDEFDFLNTDDVSLGDLPTLTFSNVAIMDEFWSGTNGFPLLNPAPGSTFVYWYDGAYAICTIDWCGPYQTGEGN